MVPTEAVLKRSFSDRLEVEVGMTTLVYARCLIRGFRTPKPFKYGSLTVWALKSLQPKP